MIQSGSSLRRLACAVCVGLALSGKVLFAQESDSNPETISDKARRAADIQRMAEEDLEMRERSIQMMREFLNDTPNARQPLSASQDRVRRLVLFRDALREFETSRQQLSKVPPPSPSEGHARKMEESAKAMLEFVKLINRKHPRMDSGEFKGFTNDDLLREIVTTAARVVPSLAAVIVNEVQSSVDVKFLASLPQLELDLLRLQWMTRRLR